MSSGRRRSACTRRMGRAFARSLAAEGGAVRSSTSRSRTCALIRSCTTRSWRATYASCGTPSTLRPSRCSRRRWRGPSLGWARCHVAASCTSRRSLCARTRCSTRRSSSPLRRRSCSRCSMDSTPYPARSGASTSACSRWSSSCGRPTPQDFHSYQTARRPWRCRRRHSCLPCRRQMHPTSSRARTIRRSMR